MFNIAICDDEEILIDELKENLIKYDCKRKIASTLTFLGGCFAATDI